MPLLFKPRWAPLSLASATVARSADTSPPAWPGVQQLLAARGARGASAWLKTWARSVHSRGHQPLLLGALARHPAWGQRFTQDPRYFHCALSHFIDRRHGSAERMAAMARDLDAAALAFGPALTARIAAGERVRLWSLNDDVHLELALNDVSYHEGLWALALRDSAGRRLYYLSLSFRSHRALLVPTLQGPCGSEDDARGVIRGLTKAAEGLRPPALLMAALRAAAAAWSCTALAGIAPQHHIKGRWNLRHSRLRFDYSGFWQEQGGQPADDGHWALPLAQACRAPADAPSNKRAMYRRRQALVDQLGREVAAVLTGRPEALPLAA